MAAFMLTGVLYAPASNAQTITVGSGTGTANQFPINYNYSYNYTQTIYTAAEITAAGGTAGQIFKIKYCPVYALSTEQWNNWTIYIGQTSKAGFANNNDWMPADSMTEAFTGNIPGATIANTWMPIQLTTPVYWDGVSNLVIAVYENTPGYSPNSSTWKGYTLAPTSGSKGMYYRNDVNNPNPYLPPPANLLTNKVAKVQLEFSVPCTGTPVAGLTSSASAICQSTPFTLTASPEGLIGFSYQYQVSTNSGATWSNIGFPTNTNVKEIPAQDIASLYRVIVTCATGGTDTSAPVAVAQNVPTECYCDPVVVTPGSRYILSFSTTGGIVNINNTSGDEGEGYSDFHLTDTVMANPGDDIHFNMLAEGVSSEMGHAIWIDYNENGYFESSERVAWNNYYTGPAITGSFSIPAATFAGAKRMRVFATLGVIEPSNPCYQNSDGEYEDYTLIVNGRPDCAGSPDPGATYASSATVCLGSPVTLGVTNHQNVNGLHYAWSYSMDDGATWTTIPGATDSVYSAVPDAITIYMATVTCEMDGASSSATPVSIGFYGNIASVYPGAVCGSGSAILAATAPAASTIGWYSNETAATAMGSGETFTTPALTSTTTFYAAPISYIPITAAIGNGNYTSLSGSPGFTGQSPFAYRYGNYKHQILIHADELSAAGMVAGPINSLAFNVIGPAMGTTYGTFNNFTIAVKQTETVEMTSMFETGTSVVWEGNHTPYAGLNTFEFSSPVNWDGVSNILVQVCFHNDNNGNIDQSVEVAFDYTAYPAHTIYRWNYEMPGICDALYGNSLGDGPVTYNRPQIIFNASGACAGLRVPVVAAVNEPVAVNLGAPVTICSGDVVTLDAGDEGSSYVWNTGATSQAINVSEPGTYQVTVQEGACSSSSAIVISEAPAAVTGSIVVINNAPTFSFSAPAAEGGVSYTWNFGDGATATSETATHTYAGSGSYTVTFSAENTCGEISTTSTTVIVSELGIAQTNSGLQAVQVYPNPSAGLTVIDAGVARITAVDVMDNLGRVVARMQPNAVKTSLDVSGMTPGVYTLRIQTNQGNSSVKLVVSR